MPWLWDIIHSKPFRGDEPERAIGFRHCIATMIFRFTSIYTWLPDKPEDIFVIIFDKIYFFLYCNLRLDKSEKGERKLSWLVRGNLVVIKNKQTPWKVGVANPQVCLILKTFVNSHHHIEIHIATGQFNVIAWLNQSQNSWVYRLNHDRNTEKIMDIWRGKRGPHPRVRVRPLSAENNFQHSWHWFEALIFFLLETCNFIGFSPEASFFVSGHILTFLCKPSSYWISVIIL